MLLAELNWLLALSMPAPTWSCWWDHLSLSPGFLPTHLGPEPGRPPPGALTQNSGPAPPSLYVASRGSNVPGELGGSRHPPVIHQ